MSQLNPELVRIFDDLQRKPYYEDRERAAIELRNAYQRHIMQCEEIFTRIQKLINSSELSEKMSGLTAVDYLVQVIQENQYMSFVNKFVSVTFQQFYSNNDDRILRKASEVYGKLLRLGGTKIAQIMEKDVKETTKWLKNDGSKEFRKFAAILALQELLKEAPFITFNILFSNSGAGTQLDQKNSQYMLVWNLIKNRRQMLREEALNFFNECVKQISQREHHLQTEQLTKFYEEIKKTMESNEQEVIHGNLCAINILLIHANKDIFEQQFKDIMKFVLSKKDSNSILIQKAVISTIPTLSQYDKNTFIQTQNLKLSIEYLLKSVKTDKKALCYNTLSQLCRNMDENAMKEYTQRIVKTISEELSQNQQKRIFCVECIICLESILHKFKQDFTNFTDIQVLIDNILLNGLYPQSIQFLQNISKVMEGNPNPKVANVSEYIQCKLLLAISVILIGKLFTFSHPPGLEPLIIHKFQTSLQGAFQNPEFQSDEGRAMAINTLTSFGFDAYLEDLARFVKDCVLHYLANPTPKIRKAAAQAGCLLYVQKGKGQSISKNIMYEILDKFLNVAISDTEVEIRQEMLASLNENFDQYMNSPNYLRKLFLCVNDSNPKVQELALMILCRLARFNPSDIVPFMKKTLFQYLSQLPLYEIQNEGQVIDLITLLTCFIKHGPHIVKNHCESIASILIQHLKDPRISSHLIPSLLKAFSQLTALGEPQVMVYLYDIIPIILQAVQDKSYTAKREAAVKSLVEICKNTGYVILPYYRYPQLMEVILNLLKNETNQEIRMECLRLVGCLGTIDHFYYKRVSQEVLDKNSNIQDIDDVIHQNLNIKFNSIKKYQIAKQNCGKNDLVQELHKYYEDLILLGNINQQKKMFLYLANLQSKLGFSVHNYTNTQSRYNNQMYNNYQNNQNQINEQHFLQDSTKDYDIDELLSQATVIQLNNTDYYSTVTIKTLLKILCDSSLRSQHDLAIETLMCILGTLKSRTSHFLNLIIPVFKKIINTVDLKQNLLKLIEKIIKHCGVYFDVEWIDSIIQIFLENANTSTDICFDIMITLITYCKNHLRNKVELLIREINNLIRKNENDRQLIHKALTIYKNLGDLLDSYLHMIIPFLCKLIVKEHDSIDNEIRKEIIELFKCLSINCSSTIQNLSLIVESLIQVMKLMNKKQTPAQAQTMQCVVSCFVIFILKYKNSFLVYLPLVNNAISKYKVHNNRYKECVETLLNYGNLYDIHSLLKPGMDSKDELNEFNQYQKNLATPYTVDQQNQNKETHMFKKIDAMALIKEFDTSQKTLKEDWKEWMRKSSVELLRQSPNLVLSPCHSIAEVYPELSTELYNIAFACVWGVLLDKQKEFIISQLHKVINPQTNENIPVEILQTILNLAEFMQHDKEGLQIDNSTLGDLAERCEAYAKALYYREHEFETASEKTIESLISLYTNLGQKEAAAGLLLYAKKNLKIDVKMTWYERLMNWEKALDDYRMKQLSNPEQDNFVPKMRCLNALSDWELLMKQCDPILDNIENKSEEKQQQSKEVIHLAANAAMHLGNWGKLEKYTKQVPNENLDKEFWSAAICIQKNQYQDAQVYIQKSMQKLDSKVSGLLLESYNRAYDSLLRLQQLYEMEEIIEFKQAQHKVEKLSKDSRGEFKTEMLMEYEKRKEALKIKWNDRLHGNPRDLDTWQKVLSVRQLLFSKSEDIDTWVKFARLALKQDQMQISNRTIESLKLEINPQAKDEFDYPPKLVVANLECEYKMSKINEEEHNEKLTQFLLNDKKKNIDSKLKAKMFLKMGKEMIEKTDELSFELINNINKQFLRSFEFNKEYHKTWHAFALLNYDAVTYYKNSEENTNNNQQNFENHIFAALKGFIKSIALGSKAENRSKFLLQDSLRLLQIIFQYGNNQKIAKEFDSNFETIDITTWIEVVPQIIARIANQQLLHKLLIHISRHHPQALIYPLTVACKDKLSGRAKAAQVILDDMKQHSPTLVQQALLISDELNRSAILMNEKWYEGIENAWKDHHSNETNSKGFISQLQELHEMMKQPPESLSEIAFHQNFGSQLNEAESWLQKYIETQNEICLCQAFDIYYQVYIKIQAKLDTLKNVYLENVSPKLLATKNCEISIPGLYQPNKAIIKIACFQPKLLVLNSKQKPRRLFIYGSDSKQYGFLLKGREDLRQDERVMQLFALVNRLLQNNLETEKKDLLITRYSVIPLSTQTGLLGWVQDCDTLQVLIKDYREIYNIRASTEANLKNIFCLNYTELPLPNKVEIFRHILENTKGEDLQKVLWLKSNTSETWLERRTNYTRSLATMSIVGYILGLGDRHPSNIMLQRYTGKIVHIDFGDCFEVAMKREKFPEKVPFRLTRMLVNAMEACGLEGNYRNICNSVMRVCRENKESLLAVLEAFVYDPIITWKLLTIEDTENINDKQSRDRGYTTATNDSKQQQQQQQKQQQSLNNNIQQQNVGYVGSMMRQTTIQHLQKQERKKTKQYNVNVSQSLKRKEEEREREIQQLMQQDNEIHKEIKNKKALEVLDRIKKKLVGRDFKEKEHLNYEEQVKKLIIQATSHENICQAYIGWCPFW